MCDFGAHLWELAEIYSLHSPLRPQESPGLFCKFPLVTVRILGDLWQDCVHREIAPHVRGDGRQAIAIEVGQLAVVLVQRESEKRGLGAAVHDHDIRWMAGLAPLDKPTLAHPAVGWFRLLPPPHNSPD